MDLEEHNQIYLRLVHSAGGTVDDFLADVFSFLRRKTDFFHIKESPADPKGFEPGEAEDIVIRAFHHQWHLHNQEKLKEDRRNRAILPPVTEGTETSNISSEARERRDPPVPQDEDKPAPPAQSATDKKTDKANPKGSLIYQGAGLEYGVWSQPNYKSVEVIISLKGSVSAKDCHVRFTTKAFSAHIDGLDIHIEETLTADVVPSECFWELEQETGARKVCLVLYLEKAKSAFWEHLSSEKKPHRLPALNKQSAHFYECDQATQEGVISAMEQRKHDQAMGQLVQELALG